MTWMLMMVLACGGKQEPPPEAPAEAAPAETPAEAEAEGDDAMKQCIAACHESRMAEAVDWSVIETQCAMQCSGDDGGAPTLE